jgi:dihydrofolate reductase
MRKLNLQIQMTVDGYIAGVNGEMEFMEQNWDPALIAYIQKLTGAVDCIVLGRKLAEGFIPYWADVATKPDNPEYTAGKKFTDTTKIVFTKTLDKAEWENTTLAKGDLVEEINNLKNQAGNDIIAYGGGSFVSALIKHDLIDEYHLLVNPTAIGDGMTIFKALNNVQNLSLIEARSFDCGIVLLNYQPKRG